MPAPFQWKAAEATPGVELIHEETQRTAQNVIYRIFAIGAPRDKHYQLWTKNMDGRTTMLVENIRLDNPELPGGVSALGLSKMFEGEPILYAVVSDDKAVKAFSKIIPFPVQATGAGGCALSLEIVSPDRQVFAAWVTGFTPHEEVLTWSSSADEILEGKNIVPPVGKFLLLLMPGVLGKTGGEATFAARGRSCEVTLPYRWGTESKMR